MTATTNQPGFFAITKGKIIIVVSLILTWWIAFLLPHYTPVIQESIRTRLEEARQSLPKIKVDWKAAPDPRARYNATKIALIVESRPVPHLVPQILHMIYAIPPDWRMVFIGTDQSAVAISRAYAIKNQQVIGKLDVMVLPEPWEIDSKEKVHRLMTDLRFYDEFLPGVEWILRFESDSILCANSETSLNEWLDWSWAGAPRTAEDRFAGNGGLSLRKVSAIRRVLGFQARYNDTEPEDEWYGKRLWVLPGEKVAAGADGALAVEDVYMENPMGYHLRSGGSNLNDDVWKDHKRRESMFKYCPELSLIMDMKLQRERCDGDDMEGTIKPDPEEQKKKEAEAKQKAEEEKKKAEEAKKKAEEEERKVIAAEEAAKAKATAAAATGKQAQPKEVLEIDTSRGPEADEHV